VPSLVSLVASQASELKVNTKQTNEILALSIDKANRTSAKREQSA
jgi:hypothetical protein